MVISIPQFHRDLESEDLQSKALIDSQTIGFVGESCLSNIICCRITMILAFHSTFAFWELNLPLPQFLCSLLGNIEWGFYRLIIRLLWDISQMLLLKALGLQPHLIFHSPSAFSPTSSKASERWSCRAVFCSQWIFLGLL